MLTLTRLRGERVILSLPDGRKVTIEVSQIDHQKCRLVFDAPQDVVIDREEVYHRKLQERPSGQ